MPFYWLNQFNMIEYDGPFETADAAKEDAIETFNAIQGGMALNMTIIEVDDVQAPEFFQPKDERFELTTMMGEKGRIVHDGHIKNGKWGDGDYPG